MKRTALILLSTVALGCHFGQRVGRLTVAKQPGGIQATIAERNGTFMDAELLAVDDTGLVLLWSKRVGYLPFARALELKSDAISLSFAEPGSPSNDERVRLRLMSRFPQGLTPDLEARLLAAYHQQALVALAP